MSDTIDDQVVRRIERIYRKYGNLYPYLDAHPNRLVENIAWLRSKPRTYIAAVKAGILNDWLADKIENPLQRKEFDDRSIEAQDEYLRTTKPDRDRYRRAYNRARKNHSDLSKWRMSPKQKAILNGRIEPQISIYHRLMAKAFKNLFA